MNINFEDNPFYSKGRQQQMRITKSTCRYVQTVQITYHWGCRQSWEPSVFVGEHEHRMWLCLSLHHLCLINIYNTELSQWTITLLNSYCARSQSIKQTGDKMFHTQYFLKIKKKKKDFDCMINLGFLGTNTVSYNIHIPLNSKSIKF